MRCTRLPGWSLAPVPRGPALPAGTDPDRRDPDKAVARELDRAAELCEGLGHHVEIAEPPGVDGQALSDGFFTAAALAMSQMSQTAAQMLGRSPGPAELEPFTLELIERATTLRPNAQADCERALADAGRAYLRLFERYDVVLSPTLARLPWPLGHLSPAAGREMWSGARRKPVGYTPVHNAAGCPAMTVPLGHHDGLPVGIHFAAAPGADRLLLALAYELEAGRPMGPRQGRQGLARAADLMAQVLKPAVRARIQDAALRRLRHPRIRRHVDGRDSRGRPDRPGEPLPVLRLEGGPVRGGSSPRTSQSATTTAGHPDRGTRAGNRG